MCKLRVDGYMQFKIAHQRPDDPQSRIRRGKRYCFTGTIIDATNTSEIGRRIGKGIPAWGPDGVFDSLDGKLIIDLAWREEEWIKSFHLGANEDVNHPLHPWLWYRLKRNPQLQKVIAREPAIPFVYKHWQPPENDPTLGHPRILESRAKLQSFFNRVVKNKIETKPYPPCPWCGVAFGSQHDNISTGIPGVTHACPLTPARVPTSNSEARGERDDVNVSTRQWTGRALAAPAG